MIKKFDKKRAMFTLAIQSQRAQSKILTTALLVVMGVVVSVVFTGNLNQSNRAEAAAPTITSVTPNSGPVAGGTNITITGTGFTDTYAPVAYLQFYGGQYIQTGITASNTLKTVVDAQYMSGAFVANRESFLFGSRDCNTSGCATRAYMVGTTYTTSTKQHRVYYNGTTAASTSTQLVDTNRHTWTFLNGALTVTGGTTVSVSVPAGSAFTSTRPLMLGAYNNGGAAASPFIGRMYSAQMIRGSQAVRNFTPVVNVRTGVCGMRDSVSGAFFGNSGSGAFTCPPPAAGTTSLLGVTVGGRVCTNPVLVSSTTLTCTTSANAAGLVDVVVKNGDGQTVTRAKSYTYVAPAPTVTAISPARGQGAGGASVTITGTNFASGASVKIGGAVCMSVTVVSASSLTCTTPPHAAGAVDVVITSADGRSATLMNSYIYYDVPTAPQNLTTSTAIDGISLAWDLPLSNNFSAITGYCYQYREVTAGEWSPIDSCVTTNASETVSRTTTVSVPTIQVGKTYEFRIAAINEAGQGAYTTNNPTGQTIFITITADDAIGMTIFPASGEIMSSTKTMVNVKTNNTKGYRLTLSAASTNEDLVHKDNPSKTIAPLGFTALAPGHIAGTGASKWGWRMDRLAGFGDESTLPEANKSASDYTWAGIPSLATPETLHIALSSNANDIADVGTNTDVWFAASAIASQLPGTYTTKVLWTAVSNI